MQRLGPRVFEPMMQLLSIVEETGKWPVAMISGFTTLIPKTTEPPATPLELRPITVLSALYRVWGRLRAQQLNKLWQEVWCHDGMWGGRSGRGPEPVIFEVMADLEKSTNSTFVAGLSFDLVKAFDRVPRNVLAYILRKMKMPVQVLTPYLGMLHMASRRYKLGIYLDKECPLYGGILQGCPLSMVAMNAVVHIWLSAINEQCPTCRPRSYVDDVSITAISGEKAALTMEIREAFHISDDFVQSIGGELNKKKSFTFGHMCVAGAINDNLSHSNTFRLLGGSIVFRDSDKLNPTQLEKERMKSWTKTVLRVRNLLIPWRDRCNALLRTRSQFTWGAGSHQLCTARGHEDEIIKLRSKIMRALLRRDQYTANPTIYFALLTSPSLNPFFSRIMDGLLIAWRVAKTSPQLHDMIHQYRFGDYGQHDGPLSFLRQINNLPGFQGSVDDMFETDPHDKHLWMHNVREKWRAHEFQRVSRDRPDFRGIEQGVDRNSTLKLLRKLDQQFHAATDNLQKEDLLQTSAVLRSLLSGGLLTQDTKARHKSKGKEQVLCTCTVGGPCTVFHISWFCTHYSHIRLPIDFLFHEFVQAKSCFRYAAILTWDASDMLRDNIEIIQTTLVRIWRAHITQHMNELPTNGPSPAPGHENADVNLASSTVTRFQGLEENGHFISSLNNGGVFCRKCGLSTYEPRHRRLKISKHSCKQKHIHEDYWVDVPSAKNNPHTMMDLFRTILDVANGHELAWNLSVATCGDAGKIKCLRCNASYPWNNRHNVKHHQPCTRTKKRERTPPGWISNRTPFDICLPRLCAAFIPAQKVDGRRMRLHRKTSVNQTTAATRPSSSSNSSSAVAFTPDDVIRLPQAVSSLSTGDADGTFAFFDDMG